MMSFNADASCATNYSGRELILPDYLYFFDIKWQIFTKLLQTFAILSHIYKCNETHRFIHTELTE